MHMTYTVEPCSGSDYMRNYFILLSYQGTSSQQKMVAIFQNVKLICGRGNLTVLQAITLEIESLACQFYLIKFTYSGFFFRLSAA